MKTIVSAAVVASLLLIGCSDPTNYELPENATAIATDSTPKKEIEKLSEKDDKQRAGNQENDKSRAEILAAMNTAISTLLLSIKLKEASPEQALYSDYFLIEMKIRNYHTQDLSGLKGSVVLQDSVGTELKHIGITTSRDVPAGKSLIYSATFSHDPSIEEDNKLASIETSQLQYP